MVVEVLGLSDESIWVSYPTSDVIKDGTGVELSYHTDNGFIGFHARVSAGPKLSQTGIMLERTESARDNKERRNWRVPCNFEARVQLADQESSHPGRIVDLTIDGAMIYCSATLAPASMVTLTFALPKRETTTITSQVVYVDSSNDGASNRYGLRFVKVPHEGKVGLTWYLYEQIQHIYPKQLGALYPKPPKPKGRAIPEFMRRRKNPQ